MKQGIIVAGVEQSGKTYYCELLAKKYIESGRTAVLYNVGKDADFSGAEICEPISIEDMHRTARDRKEQYAVKSLDHLPLFRDERTEKILHFSAFRKFYAGKMVKIYRVRNEGLLATSFFRYLYDSFIIFDDFRAATRHGLRHEHIELFNRKNHAGAKIANGKQGVDIAFIYHQLDIVPAELYNYVTRIVLFNLNSMPDRGKMDNADFWEHVNEAYQELKKMPRFSRQEIVIRGYPEVKRIKYIHN